jgi:branched-chain amino acid aminotransferase
MVFQYTNTDYHIQYKYIDGSWDSGKLVDDPYANISIASSCLHYGQQCFEGLKAFKHRDDSVKIFRYEDVLSRLNKSANFICAPNISEKMFYDALCRVIKANMKYIPSYNNEGSLYIRPLLIGISPTLGVSPSKEYLFIIFVSPVSDYYKKSDKDELIDVIVSDDCDRSTITGTGSYKLGANYALTLRSSVNMNANGFHTVLFLDPKEHIYIDEFTTSNFIAITEDNRYVTPESNTILPSITNNSLMKIAKDYLGMKVEVRPVKFDEIKNFSEIGSCGTAAVISSVRKIVQENKEVFRLKKMRDNSVLNTLKKILVKIQKGDMPNSYNWLKAIS